MLKDINFRCRLVIRSGEENFLGPGRVELLEKIGESGSISQAAREMGMSYRKAWGLVENMNHLNGEPLVLTQKGGKEGGGATLTEVGRDLLAEYRNLFARIQEFVESQEEQFRK